MPDINLFTGGINRHKDARKLDLNELTSIVDGEISSGSVVSLARPILYKRGVNPVFVEYKDEVVSGSGEYLKYTKALNYLFRCNGEKPQYTVGKKDVNNELEWNPLGIDPVDSIVTVKKLSATMSFSNLGNRGTSEVATYNYAALLDEGLSTERVYAVQLNCTKANREFVIFPNSINQSYTTLSLYRKYGSSYYKLASDNPIVDFVAGATSTTAYPEIVDAQFTYIAPKAPAVPNNGAWYGTLFRTNGNGEGRFWVIASQSSEHSGNYEWSDTPHPHFGDSFNFKTGSGPTPGTQYTFSGLTNGYIFMTATFIGKELYKGTYIFTFDIYHVYGSVQYKQFMYRIAFGYNYQWVSALEDLAADMANTTIPIQFRKSEPTVYRNVAYQEFTATSSSDGLRSQSATMDLTTSLSSGLNGNFQYALTYSDDLGQETAAGEYSTAVSVEGASLEVTIPLPPDLDPSITTVNLYRMNTSIYGGQTSFLFVKSFPVSGLPTVYIDNAQPSDLGGIIPGETITAVPDDLLFLTTYTGRLFGATKDLAEPSGVVNDYSEYLTVRWSEVGKPLTWLGNSWLNMDAPITGIGTSSNGLLIFSLTETFALLGTESEPFTHRLLSSSQGCVDFRSIQNWQGNCIFASVEGICTSNGGTVELISYPKLGLLKTISVDNASYKSVADSEIRSSALVGNTYFLLFKNSYILKLDLISGVFTEMSADLLGLGLFNGRLHGVDTSANLNVIPYQVGGDKQYSVVTGLITESAISNLKEYDKIRVCISGRASMDVMIDGKSVLSRVNLVDGVNTIGIPNERNKGYSIQFKVGGVGALHNIEYSVGGRQNA